MSKKIVLYGVEFEVSEKEYAEFLKAERRMRYYYEAENTLHMFSYDSLDINGRPREELIADPNMNVEEEVCKKLMMDKLFSCLRQLSDEELFLIEQLIFQEKTERQLSKITGINRSTLNYQKTQILKKLKKMMEN